MATQTEAASSLHRHTHPKVVALTQVKNRLLMLLCPLVYARWFEENSSLLSAPTNLVVDNIYANDNQWLLKMTGDITPKEH
ncbi:MAG: hypothetical protein KAG53_02685 [Endozoicomonadaceae bacterium]|nr:hypothetical protein [Endozoicomonadaceae bacterium]